VGKKEQRCEGGRGGGVAREKTMGDDDHPFIVLTETKFSRVTGRREREREREVLLTIKK